VKKEGNIDYQVDSNSVSVIVRGVVNLAMVFVFVIEGELGWK
jgi:hypothetical protein